MYKMQNVYNTYIFKNSRPSAAHIYALALKPITNDAHNPVDGERSTQPMLLQTYLFFFFIFKIPRHHHG